jgi:peptide-methionine (R)-S-oxide reductase
MRISRRAALFGACAFSVLAGCSAAGDEPIRTRANEARFANHPIRRLTRAQWRARLEPAAFRVLREEGTERAGTSPLNGEHRPGTFVCAGCGLPLFRSEWKFESGTGWPSFSRVMVENVGTKQDFLLLQPRTEYHCARCLGHQGHVFPDGPPPTGLRYCNNGVALRFVPA